MTNSEELTSLIAQKFFLQQYIHTDIYVLDGKQETEFCDCIIEFSNVYVFIQIKERKNQKEENSAVWFKNKVLKTAKNQLKKTVSYYNNQNNKIFSKNSDFIIDRSKTFIPLIVFYNTNIISYDRIIYSNSLNKIINIFSYDDFKKMLKSIILPYDILNYLEYRTVFHKKDRSKLIVDDIDKHASILFTPQTEDDYAQLFLVRTYYPYVLNNSFHEEYLKFYNEILLQLNEKNCNKRNDFIEGLLHVDCQRVNIIVENWIECVDNISLYKFSQPFIITYDNYFYLLISHPKNMTKPDFMYRLYLCLVYQKYKYDYKKAYVIEFSKAPKNTYSISLYNFDLNSDIPYDDLKDDAIKLFES